MHSVHFVPQISLCSYLYSLKDKLRVRQSASGTPNKHKCMNNQYRYTLEPYGSGRQYAHCPSCGESRYVRYVDTQTGEYLPIEYGRCERINNCGYHKSPKELINPLKNNKMELKNENLNVVETTSEITNERIEKSSMLAPVDKTNIFNVALLFFLSLIYGVDKVLEVAQMYGLYLFNGFSKDGKYAIGFPQIDLAGKIRQIKAMAYSLSGKRIKLGEEFLTYNTRSGKNEKVIASADYLFSPIRFLGKILMRGFDFVNQQTFFGAHLIEMYPEKIKAIVESEKTAIIGSIEKPEFVWLATGGQFGCRWTSEEVYSILKGHKVVLFPDLKATEDWKIKAEKLAAAGIDVSVYEKLEEEATAEDKTNGLDIADFFLRKRIEENPQLLKVSNPIAEKNEVKIANISDFDSLFGSSNTDAPKPQINSISSEEFKALLPTDEDLKKFDKTPKTTLEHDFSDMDKIIGLNSDAVADIA